MLTAGAKAKKIEGLRIQKIIIYLHRILFDSTIVSFPRCLYLLLKFNKG